MLETPETWLRGCESGRGVGRREEDSVTVESDVKETREEARLS